MTPERLLQIQQQAAANVASRQQAPQQTPQGNAASDNGLLSLIPFFDSADLLLSEGKVDPLTLGLDVASVLPFGTLARGAKVATGIGKATKAGKAATTAGRAGRNLATGSKAAGKADDVGRLTGLGRSQRLASTGVEDAISTGQAGKSLFTRDRVERAGQTVINRFKGKSPKSITGELPKVRDTILGERRSLLRGTTGSVSASTLNTNIKRNLKQFAMTPGDERKVTEALRNNIPQLTKKGAKFDAEDLQDISKSINANIKPTAFEVGGSSLNRAEDLQVAIKEAVDEGLETLVKGDDLSRLRGLNGELSDLFTINKGATAASRGVAASPFGIPITKNVAKRAQRGASDRLLNLTGDDPTRTFRRPLSTLGIQALGSGAAAPQPSTPSELASAASEIGTPPVFSQQQAAPEQGAGFFTEQEILAAIQQDILQTGGENFDQLQDLLEIAGEFGGGQAEADPEIASLSNSVDLLLDNFEQAGGGQGAAGIASSLLGRTPGIRSAGLAPEAQVFEDKRKALIAPLARKISGEVGVLTDRDISRAEGLLPRLTDPPQVAQQKIDELKFLIQQAGQAQ